MAMKPIGIKLISIWLGAPMPHWFLYEISSAPQYIRDLFREADQQDDDASCCTSSEHFYFILFYFSLLTCFRTIILFQIWFLQSKVTSLFNFFRSKILVDVSRSYADLSLFWTSYGVEVEVRTEKTGEGGLKPVMLTRGRGDLWRQP
jgi:hypothetical protein